MKFASAPMELLHVSLIHMTFLKFAETSLMAKPHWKMFANGEILANGENLAFCFWTSPKLC